MNKIVDFHKGKKVDSKKNLMLYPEIPAATECLFKAKFSSLGFLCCF